MHTLSMEESGPFGAWLTTQKSLQKVANFLIGVLHLAIHLEESL